MLLNNTQKSLESISRDNLDENDQISYDILKRDLELSQKGLSFPDNLIPLNQFYGFHLTFAQLGSGSVIQPFATKKDYENWAKRMTIGAQYLDSSIVYFPKCSATVYRPSNPLTYCLLCLRLRNCSNLTHSRFNPLPHRFPYARTG